MSCKTRLIKADWMTGRNCDFKHGIIIIIIIIIIGASHYNNVTMSAMASRIIGIWTVCSVVVQAHIKENIKAPRHWPVGRQSTGDRWIFLAKSQWQGECTHLMTSSCSLGTESMMILDTRAGCRLLIDKPYHQPVNNSTEQLLMHTAIVHEQSLFA